MNLSEELLIEIHYRQKVDNCLASLLKEFESGKSKDSNQEHDELKLRYCNLLESNLEMYFKHLTFLTPYQLNALLMNMSQPLFRQFKKGDDHQQIAYVIQLKGELESMEKKFEQYIVNMDYGKS
jgi:hypothetical protein